MQRYNFELIFHTFLLLSQKKSVHNVHILTFFLYLCTRI